MEIFLSKPDPWGEYETYASCLEDFFSPHPLNYLTPNQVFLFPRPWPLSLEEVGAKFKGHGLVSNSLWRKDPLQPDQ